MILDLRTVTDAEAATASAVVHASFVEIAAADWESRAQQRFLAESSPEALVEILRVAAHATGAFVAEEMVGFILMPTPALLGMLFVHPHWLRRGIGRALWENARDHIEFTFPAVKTVELNATACALQFYRSVGFVPISAEFEREGCHATRMACWLPARALGAECALTPSCYGRAASAAPRSTAVRPARRRAQRSAI
jgi:GNAT superfamily N-acetyltransferase